MDDIQYCYSDVKQLLYSFRSIIKLIPDCCLYLTISNGKFRSSTGQEGPEVE